VNEADAKKIRVLVADDHAIVRQGLKTFLDLQADIEVVGEAVNGLEAISLTVEFQPDIILMDLVMPELDGIEAIKKIVELGLDTKVIVLTSFAEDDKIFPAIKAGASGYQLKDVSPENLANTIRAVERGESILHSEVAQKLMREVSGESKASSLDALTDRELEVLRLIARGMNNHDIGEELYISEKTVKTHVSNILGKLYHDDRTQEAIFALKNGLA
jgi:NarL family two-component system response regulator LiaR